MGLMRCFLAGRRHLLLGRRHLLLLLFVLLAQLITSEVAEPEKEEEVVNSEEANVKTVPDICKELQDEELDECQRRFQPVAKWVVDNGGKIHPALALKRFPDQGWGWITTEDLERDTELLKIPSKCEINGQIAYKPVQGLLDVLPHLSEDSEKIFEALKAQKWDRLWPTLPFHASLFLLIEKMKGEESFWSPLINSLPEQCSTAYCYPLEVANTTTNVGFLLQVTMAEAQDFSLYDTVITEAAKIMGWPAEEVDKYSTGKGIDVKKGTLYQTFRWSKAMIDSQSFGGTLAPLVNLFNYHQDWPLIQPSVYDLSKIKKAKAEKGEEMPEGLSFTRVTLNRPEDVTEFRKGTQIFLRYGHYPLTMSQGLFQYGFCPIGEVTPNDSFNVMFDWKPSGESFQQSMKDMFIDKGWAQYKQKKPSEILGFVLVYQLRQPQLLMKILLTMRVLAIDNQIDWDIFSRTANIGSKKDHYMDATNIISVENELAAYEKLYWILYDLTSFGDEMKSTLSIGATPGAGIVPESDFDESTQAEADTEEEEEEEKSEDVIRFEREARSIRPKYARMMKYMLDAIRLGVWKGHDMMKLKRYTNYRPHPDTRPEEPLFYEAENPVITGMSEEEVALLMKEAKEAQEEAKKSAEQVESSNSMNPKTEL